MSEVPEGNSLQPNRRDGCFGDFDGAQIVNECLLDSRDAMLRKELTDVERHSSRAMLAS